jgi:hypothetical protein
MTKHTGRNQQAKAAAHAESAKRTERAQKAALTRKARMEVERTKRLEAERKHNDAWLSLLKRSKNDAIRETYAECAEMLEALSSLSSLRGEENAVAIAALTIRALAAVHARKNP